MPEEFPNAGIPSDVNDVFEKYPIGDLLRHLANRCQAESAIAYGEGRRAAGRFWIVTAEHFEELSWTAEDFILTHQDE